MTDKYDVNRKLKVDVSEFENFVIATHGKRLDTPFYGVALSEEVGELNGKIKRLLRGDFNATGSFDKAEFRRQILLEAGDILNYLTGFVNHLDSSIPEVIQLNYEKLADRHNRGVVKGTGDVR